MKFTYVLVGWEGSAHDALILADALERNDGFVVPEGSSSLYYYNFKCSCLLSYYNLAALGSFYVPVGKFYLVHAGYGCRNGFLRPYRG
jgi:hypothetical protein